MGAFSSVMTRRGLAARSVAALLLAALAGMAMASEAVAASIEGSYGGVRFRVALSGAQEVPPADADGKGIAWLKVKPNRDRLCYALSVSNIDGDVTAAHIHQAPAGVNGPIVVPLQAPISGPVADCTDIDHDLALEIVNNPAGFYVNVHSTVFPAGAVRGQLM